jgi:hypothetical protein
MSCTSWCSRTRAEVRGLRAEPERDCLTRGAVISAAHLEVIDAHAAHQEHRLSGDDASIPPSPELMGEKGGVERQTEHYA